MTQGGNDLRVLEETQTTRTWDALHILLTGCENEDRDNGLPSGDSPARDVVMGGLILGGGTSRLNTPLPLWPDEVRAVAAHLRGIDLDALNKERYELLVEIGPYSFTGYMRDGENPNMVQAGVLAEDFEVLRSFYGRAAAGGNAVIKGISQEGS